jgi:hypothetical protein
MNAKYKYRYIENNEVLTGSTLVEIIKNDKKTYLVKLIGFCRGYPPGKVIRVHKKSISF